MGAAGVRRILHVDMDAFYASVEQRDDPSLRGRPVAVGGSPESRGVVAAASYEARAFGVFSAVPMSRAVRLCPELVIVRPDFSRYKAASDAVFAIFREATSLVEGLSLDEAFLDVTENAWGLPLGVEVARRLKTRIREETRLTASAGVAPNKFLAKIASGWRKPDGLTVIAPERVEAFLQGLPVEALWGVGPKIGERLRKAGIRKLVDVRSADAELLRSLVGSWADGLKRMSHGEDDRPVEPHRERKSVGCEETFARDLTEIERMRHEIEILALRVSEYLERKNLRARTVTLKLRYGNFETVTRSHTEDPPTATAADLIRRSVALLDRTEASSRSVRLLGVSVHGLRDENAQAPEPAAPDIPFDPQPL
jgi:DNA polymerase-4